MSVFLAPPPGAQITAQTRQFRAYILLVGVRKLSLILALLGAFGSVLHFVILGIFRHVFLSGVLITRLGGLFRRNSCLCGSPAVCLVWQPPSVRQSSREGWPHTAAEHCWMPCG